MQPQYLDKLEHYINGDWVQPTSGKTEDVMNPSTNITFELSISWAAMAAKNFF
jgi:acyl-CoA reductase-like NAD-dependent aldehyde dehydrogenase